MTRPEESKRRQPEGSTRRGLFVALAAIVLAGAFAAWQVSSWPVRLRYPGEWGSIEGIPLAEMLHLRQGVPIYSSVSPERFDAANYGPLFYMLGAKLVNPRAPSYLPLRLLSTLGTLGCAVACALLAFWIVRSFWAFVLAPLLFLAQALVTFYGCAARCDSVALLLSFSGLLLAFRLRDRPAILLAGPLMLLSFFYKQQFLAAPLAVLIYLLLRKRYRWAALFAAEMGLGGLAGLALFQFGVFPAQNFFQHFYSYNLLPFSWERLASGLPVFGILFFVPLLVGMECLRQCPHLLLKCYLGCVVVFAILPVGRQGSDTNYFFECALLVSALFAALLAKAITNRSAARDLLVLLGTTVLVGQLFSPAPPRAEDFRRDRAVQDFLRGNFARGTPALGYYAGDLVRAGLDTPIPNLFHYFWLIRNGTVPEQSLLTQIQGHRFGLIVANNSLQSAKSPEERDAFLTEPVRKAILVNYRLEASLVMPAPERFHPEDRFYVWVPRGRVQVTEQAGPE